MKCEVEEAMIAIQELTDARELDNDRGGDAALLSNIAQDPKQSVHSIKPKRHSTIKPLSEILATDRPDTSEQTLREQLSIDHPVNTVFKTDNSWQYELYHPKKVAKNNNTTKPANSSTNQIHSLASKLIPFQKKPDHNLSQDIADRSCSSYSSTQVAAHSIFSKAFESRLLQEWKKLTNDETWNAHIDPFVLMAIFEQLDIHISFSFAKRCFEEVVSNQQGKYHFFDVLKWFRNNHNPHSHLASKKTMRPDETRTISFVTQVKDILESAHKDVRALFGAFARQRRILQGS